MEKNKITQMKQIERTFGIMLLVSILITFGSIILEQKGFMIIGFIILVISVIGKFIFNKLDKIETTKKIKLN